MMNCPVCPTDNIPDESDSCPGCGTDLSPLRRVRELGSALYQEAVDLAGNGATDIAIQRTVCSLCLNERQIEPRIFLGKLYWKKRQVREAINQWSQVTAASPENEAAKALLAKARRRLLSQSIGKWAGLTILICFFALCLWVLLTTYSHYGPKLTELEEFAANTADRLNGFETQFGELEQRFGRQMEQLSDILDNTVKRQIQTQSESLAAIADSVDSLGKQTGTMEAQVRSILQSQHRSDDRISQIVEDVNSMRESTWEKIHSTETAVGEMNAATSTLKSLYAGQIGSLMDLCESFLCSYDDRYKRTQRQLQDELNQANAPQSRRPWPGILLFGSSRRGFERVQREQIEEELATLDKEHEAVVKSIQQALAEMKELRERASR